ncbi:ClpP/crotonase [Cryphonectria parasitica EP155]|uniref:ClpP/crotonase n=1 Tax=Cryphonectria parasitica (strain ATCC 38755 / EP155) TaxID=660469 RepID=A0A9P4Y3P7_CRYP1|nr:ClpP/crotonase [Cryphonectria parasitica EP155]KAF3766051.1 ClpP/crotonase [Cryphonectria parasitica EP155]
MATPPQPPGEKTTLFTVPVPACDSHPGGTVTVTEPLPQHYLVTITSPPDNRLTTALCTALLRALDLVELSGLPPGVVITTSGLPKFYSNGLDLPHAVAHGDAYWTGSLWKLYRRLLTYPMPTVAWVGGHAFAGGLMLAMHHDYRVMNPNRGFACLNELEFGAPLKPAMSAIFRVKVPSPHVYREMVLEARRFGGAEAAAKGIVDVAGGWDEVVALVKDRALTTRGKTGVYGLLKMEMYRECVDLLENHGREEAKDRAWVAAEEARVKKGKEEVEAWVRAAEKAKL